jgi:hypothetical protein
LVRVLSGSFSVVGSQDRGGKINTTIVNFSCKHVYEIGKTQKFKFFLKGHKDSKRH